jgi:hypothetical protein
LAKCRHIICELSESNPAQARRCSIGSLGINRANTAFAGVFASNSKVRYEKVDRSLGKAGYIIAWLLGVPIPILLLVFLLRGCN